MGKKGKGCQRPGIAWETWLQQDGNAKKFWTPQQNHEEVDLPHMLQVLAVVAKFIMEDTRVAKYVYDFVSDLPLQDDSPLVPVPADVEFLKLWFLGGGNVTSPLVALELQPVVTDNEIFQDWKEQVLISNLGPQDESPTVAPPQQYRKAMAAGEMRCSNQLWAAWHSSYIC
jgi:hypothetical protein